MASVLALGGFMGSGKSSVGREVAGRLGTDFVDLDQEFETRSGTSIPEYFRQHGETEFRAREAELLERVLDESASDGAVIALGGGTLENRGSRSKLRSAGRVVVLEVDAETAWRRVEGSGRPLATDRTAFGKLLAERAATYEDAADWLLPTSGAEPAEVAQQICDVFTKAGDSWDGLWVRRLESTSRPSLIVGGNSALTYLSGSAQEARAQGRALHLITDTNVWDHWGKEVSSCLGGVDQEAVRVVSPGEPSKTADVMVDCWEWLAERKARRQDIVVAVGGGVVGDLAGLVASTYGRGIGLWQLPTSLVAQVDSSVGGKTAINLRAGKNLVGTFYQPDLAVVDPSTLRTLPEEEYRGALGEIVKHALLRSEDSLQWLEDNADAIAQRDEAVLGSMVQWNVWLKASVVEADEKESGQRAMLNLGHTTAHALERILGYGNIHHGRAVALGLVVALAVSERLLGLDQSVRGRVKTLLEGWGMETTLQLPSTDAVLDAASYDKKAASASSGFVGLRRPGEPSWGLDLSGALFAECLEVIEA